ncbi:uncharacterized protein [Maniola hyperantus]|uniref:uncharacterized protein n=1 Tax=Aphantopus hyperantus TaxID=2795564 RepID=UPI00212323CE
MYLHEQLEIKLIRAVKAKPVLYDHTHVKYKNSFAREDAWQKIGEDLNCSVPDGKVKWNCIKQYYSQILKKEKSGHQRLKPYRYENEISFLKPFLHKPTLKVPTAQLQELKADDGCKQGNDNCGDEGIQSNHSDKNSSEPIERDKPLVLVEQKLEDYLQGLNPVQNREGGNLLKPS